VASIRLNVRYVPLNARGSSGAQERASNRRLLI